MATPHSHEPEDTRRDATQVEPGTRNPKALSEIRLISHSNLFYWWPVWSLAFFLAIWTFVEGNRLAVVPPNGTVMKSGPDSYTFTYPAGKGGDAKATEQLTRAANIEDGLKDSVESFAPRVSQHTWPGTVFCFLVLITIVITNVPLRGLWSAIVLVLIVFLVILFAFLGWWDNIFSGIENLRIHINLAGYLFLGLGVFVLWATATWIFDRRSYVVFTPGQIRVCEHIGASVRTYSTLGVSLEKQRDDVFRHYIFGFGSGDLILKVGGSEKHEIRMPNILGIGSRLKTVEDMLRTMSTT